MSSSNRKYAIILSIASVAFICITWGIIYNFKSRYEAKCAELEIKGWSLLTSLTEEKSKNSDLKDAMLSLMNSKGKRIPEELRNNLRPHKIHLRLNEDFCMACYDPAIKIINNVNDTCTDNRIGILGSFKSRHEYEEILKEFNDYDSLEAINMPSMNMGQPDKLQMPYLFEINENGTFESMCMLIKGEEDLIQAYLR